MLNIILHTCTYMIVVQNLRNCKMQTLAALRSLGLEEAFLQNSVPISGSKKHVNKFIVHERERELGEDRGLMF